MSAIEKCAKLIEEKATRVLQSDPPEIDGLIKPEENKE